ncbi:GumC family protein [Pedobacter insulae]|uniref:non-specific protein-tyrosine kinase n=1 Tax=Pedobacter insulae TaxID=414048 RepID=A0A1I2VUR5_9SPHI|nr:polysaccharide biosynthesis tyrosine autokinase [Pedobacter insulae]SFG92968.1 capsular exopolysaccharide family [Pedobacter insulae]
MEVSDKIEEKKPVSQSIDFYKIFKVFLSRWYWIAGCVIIALAIARLNLAYTEPVYNTMGQLKLQESNPMLSSGTSSASQVYNYTDKIQAESYVIRSQEVMDNAVKVLNYQIAYFYKDRWNLREVYPLVPFKIKIIKQDTLFFNSGLYDVKPIDNDSFSLLTPDDPKGKPKRYKYGQPISAGQMIFAITSRIPTEYNFRFNAKQELAGRIQGGLNVSEAGRFTNVMAVSQTDKNATFAADAINAVMKEYVKFDILDKRRSARQTVDFIDRQLSFITKQVDTSGNSLASYKTQNKIVDLNTTTSNIAGKLADFQSQKSLLEIELEGINQLKDQINSTQGALLPNNNLEGNVGGLLSGLITQFNSLIEARTNSLVDFNEDSEPIKILDTKIRTVKESIRKNINSLLARNQRTLQYLNSQITTLNQSLNSIPVKEQDYIKLQTSYEVNNKVRSYLTEKKLEAEMNAAAVVPGAAIVNLAYPNFYSIAINPSKTYATALVLGLAVGIGLILLVRFLNPYIYDKETVEALTRTPIIGVIRKFPEYIDKNNRQALSLSKPKSVFAESVRSVRTNLSFMASHKKSKTICITSEVSGEGKSFVTVNLASTLALIDKKIILIAADLRKSKLHKAFGSPNKVGLSSYLAGIETLENVIMHDTVHGIDFLPSGPVPPNPSELLHTEKMKELLAILAPKYDYVLVDTAPVGLVSDAIPLIRQSDVNLFVIRSGKSQLRAAAIPERLSREYGLSNLAIVLNAFGDDALHANYYTTDYSRGGGNSTYYYSDYSGYAGSGYYDEDPKKWWEFWKKK